MFVGTYTTGESQGIYGFRFDDTTGTIAPVGVVAETANPSFLAASGNRRYLFAVNEVAPAGTVTSFAVDGATGQLHAINTESSRGGSPCHLALDRTGRFLAVANYSSGNFAVLPVTADGRLGPAAAVLANTDSGPNRARQAVPHAHAVTFDATNTFLLGADLGTDRVFVYRFNPVTGATVANDPASASVEAGSGPRHLAWHPSRRLAFSVNELKSTVTAFTWDATAGRLAPLASYSTLPDDFQGASATAEIVMHPNGRVLYASNRGHDSIAVFSVDEQGRLSRSQIMPTRGETPRNFAIDPTGRWLIAANQKSGTLAVFRIDGRTGQLSPSGPLVNVAAPVCVLFL
jgi:6-phosphogluconolactonase